MKPGALVSAFAAAAFAGGQHALAAEDRKARKLIHSASGDLS